MTAVPHTWSQPRWHHKHQVASEGWYNQPDSSWQYSLYPVTGVVWCVWWAGSIEDFWSMSPRPVDTIEGVRPQEDDLTPGRKLRYVLGWISKKNATNKLVIESKKSIISTTYPTKNDDIFNKAGDGALAPLMGVPQDKKMINIKQLPAAYWWWCQYGRHWDWNIATTIPMSSVHNHHTPSSPKSEWSEDLLSLTLL